MGSVSCILSHENVTSQGFNMSCVLRIRTTSSENATSGKKNFHKEIQQVTCKIWRGATCGHVRKNKVAIEWYCT